MNINGQNRIYFISDAHLGAATAPGNPEREKQLVNWLDSIKPTTAELWLMGDIFDFWYEYSKVVPRGYVRFLGKIAEFTDAGIPVHYFVGNHDLWIFDYLPNEIGVEVHREPVVKTWNGKKFYLHHGDGLGPFDKRYKLIKKIFTNKTLQWAFERLHPNFSMSLAHFWSKKSRVSNDHSRISEFLGEDQEWLMIYAKEILTKEHYDHFVFGHRHLFYNQKFGKKSQFTYLGDWIKYYSYAFFDGEKMVLAQYQNPLLKKENTFRETQNLIASSHE